MPITNETARKPQRTFRFPQFDPSLSALKPAPLSIVKVAKMASTEEEPVIQESHLQQESAPEDAPAELSVVVDELLDGLSAKFSTVSAEIFARMDDMSRRLDNLEATIIASSDSKELKQ
ncbi:hypothetical protein MMC16_002715 [Acarospora aff. strigata]|nr:hypothetical protein [Acarospora aff. strigata]